MHEVQAGGLQWRIRSIDMTKIPDVVAVAEFAAVAAWDEDAAAAAFVDDPMVLVRALRAMDAALCAAVVEVGRDGEFEHVELVLDRDADDADAGRLWVESLDAPVRLELFNHVAAHAGGAAAGEA